MTNCFYRFPEIVFPSPRNPCRTSLEQVQNIFQKATELLDEVNNQRKYQMGVKAMEVIHAAETLLRRNFTEDEVQELRDECERKNRLKGRYSVN